MSAALLDMVQSSERPHGVSVPVNIVLAMGNIWSRTCVMRIREVCHLLSLRPRAILFGPKVDGAQDKTSRYQHFGQFNF